MYDIILFVSIVLTIVAISCNRKYTISYNIIKVIDFGENMIVKVGKRRNIFLNYRKCYVGIIRHIFVALIPVTLKN